MNVSLVIPTLNERDSIEKLLTDVAATLAKSPLVNEAELIIVDDGSTDGTVAHLHSLQLAYPIIIIERTTRGLATAVLTGFAKAKYDIVGVMDADLSHPPDLIPLLLKKLETADLAIGSRNLPGGLVENWPWYRKLSSRFATLLTRPLGVAITDPMSGYFFLKKTLLNGKNFSPLGYKILLEIVVKSGVTKIAEVAYIFRNRYLGKSKMGLRESVNFLKHLWRLITWKITKR